MSGSARAAARLELVAGEEAFLKCPVQPPPRNVSVWEYPSSPIDRRITNRNLLVLGGYEPIAGGEAARDAEARGRTAHKQRARSTSTALDFQLKSIACFNNYFGVT